MIRFRKISFLTATGFLLTLFLPLQTHSGSSLSLAVKSAVLMDMATDRILYTQNADYPIPPASITKIMTLFLAYEAVDEGKVQWTDKVRVSRKAGKTGGSRMHLSPDTMLPLGDLVIGTSVVSANDGAVAIAEYLGGNVEIFVKRMNAKARELGMTRTVFKNPNGLPAGGQVTTARDIMKLSKAYLQKFPHSLAIHSQQSYTYHNITGRNRNVLLKHYPGADGIKTGFVGKSGYNISATAKRGDTRLIAVVMGARTPGIRARETERLLDEGFRMTSNGKGG
ncbi:MAG: D-alanyl-D-alanine carboxypeptidase [Syntrophales bacterium]|nr:D-alanyl-D-alanine carboxypeptidase [Syntrophales bacterium]